MALQMTPLLIHSDSVPRAARAALEAAWAAPPERREEALYEAARELRAATDLECDEVRDLMDLPPCEE
jgi:hypothetical protein